MRIAIFHNIPSGGAKRTIYESTKRLSARHQIDVYTFTSANHEFADIRPFVQAYHTFEYHPSPLLSSPFGRLNNAIRLSDLRRMDHLSKWVAQKIETGSYDLAFIQPCQITQSPMLLQHLDTLPSVYYLQEPPRAIYENKPVRPYYKNNGIGWRTMINAVDPFLHVFDYTMRKVDLENTRRATKVLVNSHYIQEVVRNIYQVEANVSYHGVDIDKFHMIDTEKQDMVFSVGSLTPLKGFDFLIQSIGYIDPKFRPPLVIASNFQVPEERLYLEALAEKLNVKLILYNNVSDDELVRLYNSARVTVYAPIREPFGLVSLESMACGTPVVAVREGGVQEAVIHEQTGMIVERDPIQFGGVVRTLMENPGKATSYGKNGRDHVEQNWTWDRAIELLEMHLLAVAANQES
jgi:glycosyltransferase involved in cell wall biosynthesis